MKRNKSSYIGRHILRLGLCLLIASFSGCKDDDVYVDQYLLVDGDSFTVDAEGTRKYTITVSSSTAWDVKSSGEEWIAVDDITANTFTVSAVANTTGASRSTSVVISNGLNPDVKVDITQPALADEILSFYSFGNQSVVISKLGTYLAYVDIQLVSDAYTYIPVKINLLTKEETRYPALTSGVTPAVISDNGKLVLSGSDSTGSYVYSESGELTLISIDGYSTVSVTAMSSDGSVMVGYGYKQSERKYHPIKWENDVAAALDFPDTNILGNACYNGAMARGCSTDGSVVYGSEWTGYTPLAWKNGQLILLGEETVEEITGMIEYTFWGVTYYAEGTVQNYPRMTNERTNISPNGRYLTVAYYRWEEDKNTGNLVLSYCPLVFDLEESTVEVFSDFGNCGVCTVTNDGTLFYSSLYTLPTQGYAYDPAFGASETASEWASRKYGLVIPSDGIMTAVAQGEKTFSGMRMSPSDLITSYLYWAVHVD